MERSKTVDSWAGMKTFGDDDFRTQIVRWSSVRNLVPEPESNHSLCIVLFFPWSGLLKRTVHESAVKSRLNRKPGDFVIE